MKYLLVDEFGLKARDEKPKGFNYFIGSQVDPDGSDEPIEVWTVQRRLRKILWIFVCVFLHNPENFIVKAGVDDEVSSDNLS